MVQSFTAEVTRWAKASEARLDAIQKTAIQSVAEDIVLNTPVDTGFLRAGFVMSKNKPIPLKESATASKTAQKKAKDGNGPTYAEKPYQLVINSMKPGDTLYGTFTAGYALHVEYGANGREGVRMVGKAVQKWQQFVIDAIRAAKARVRSK